MKTEEVLSIAASELEKGEDMDINKVLLALVQFKSAHRPPPPYPSHKILNIACEVFDVSVEDVMSRARDREFVSARMFFFKHMSDHKVYNLKKIGALVCRTHATVLSGVKTVNNLLDVDQGMIEKWGLFQSKIEALKSKAA